MDVASCIAGQVRSPSRLPVRPPRCQRAHLSRTIPLSHPIRNGTIWSKNLTIPRTNLGFNTPPSCSRQTRAIVDAGSVSGTLPLGMEVSRLHHLASASEPAAETALSKAMHASTKAPSDHPQRPPFSLEARTTNGNAPTSTPLAAPHVPTRKSGNSSNLRPPLD